jgi:hypothetical protein
VSAVLSSWSSETWLPIPGRTTVCRFAGCGEPAVDDIRCLCEYHNRWQPKRTSHDDRRNEAQAKRRERLEHVEELLTPPRWVAQAACREHPEVNFYLEPGEDSGPAMAVCGACPVRAECAEAGLEEHHGIWGATTARERARVRATRRGSAA